MTDEEKALASQFIAAVNSLAESIGWVAFEMAEANRCPECEAEAEMEEGGKAN